MFQVAMNLTPFLMDFCVCVLDLKLAECLEFPSSDDCLVEQRSEDLLPVNVSLVNEYSSADRNDY